MRKSFTTIALFAVLGSLAVSCQKENLINQPAIVSEPYVTYMVQYSIDGVSHTVTLIGEDAWNDFLNHLFALAEEGHLVTFLNEEAASRVVSTKEAVTYTTSNYDDAYKWADKMYKEGYVVTIEYDKEKNIYTCCAEK